MRRAPLASHAVALTLSLLLISAFCWSYFSHIDSLVTARGKIVTTSPAILVQPLERSLVGSLQTGVGQVVKKGQILATLDPTFAQADLARVKSDLHGVDLQIRRLEAELADRLYIARDAADPEASLQMMLNRTRVAHQKARLEALHEQASRQMGMRKGKKIELKLLRERLSNLDEVLRMRKSLYKEKHESKLKVLEARYQKLDVLQRIEQTKEELNGIGHELVRLDAQKQALKLQWRSKIAEELLTLRRQRQKLQESLQKAIKISELIALRSPVDAMVVEVASLAPGSVVQPGQTLFSLIPLSVPLEAEVNIESRNIGYIRKDAEVRVKLDAFPFQRHGVANAKIRSLSEDVVRGTKEGGEQGFFYVARLSIKDLKLRNLPDDFRLIPGMALTAEIKVGQRRVLSYLIYPIMKGLDESLREP